MAIDYKKAYPYNVTIPFSGIKGVNLDNLSIEDFNPLEEYLSLLDGRRYTRLDDFLFYLDYVRLDEAKELAKAFYDKHFKVYPVNFVDEKYLRSQEPYLKTLDEDAMYDYVNSLLNEINPFDLELVPTGKSSFSGTTRGSTVVDTKTNNYTNPKRKHIFHKIFVGGPYNKMTSSTLVHEVTHMEQLNKHGSTRDFLNYEMLPIFLEKVAAYELDPSGETLRLLESLRFRCVLKDYKELVKTKSMLVSEKIEHLMYVKSTVQAIKLFDMYIHDPDKKSYFDEIQQVFDGTKQIEDIIKIRHLELPNCFDSIKRHN